MITRAELLAVYPNASDDVLSMLQVPSDLKVPETPTASNIAQRKGHKKAHPHQDFIDQIVETAHLYHWKVAYSRPGRVKVKGKETYRTAWGADGVGFPDLVLVSELWQTGTGYLTYFWEVKIPPDKTTKAQREWLRLLGGRVVMPSDWDWIIEELALG